MPIVKVKRIKGSLYRPKAQGGGERYSSNLSSASSLEGVGWLAPRSGRFNPLERPDTHCAGGRVASGPVWTCAENLSPTGIRSSDRLARSQFYDDIKI
jgi:hypothetical protein